MIRNPCETSIVLSHSWDRILLWWQETNFLQKIYCEEEYFIPSKEFSHADSLWKDSFYCPLFIKRDGSTNYPHNVHLDENKSDSA